ncbi:hypothetical protein VCM44_02730 [Halobacteriovorax sp. DPLXC-1]
MALNNAIQKYMNRDEWIASDLFNELYTKRKHVAFEKSLSFLFPISLEIGIQLRMIYFYLNTLLLGQGESFGGEEDVGIFGKIQVTTEQVVEAVLNVDIRGQVRFGKRRTLKRITLS